MIAEGHPQCTRLARHSDCWGEFMFRALINWCKYLFSYIFTSVFRIFSSGFRARAASFSSGTAGSPPNSHTTYTTASSFGLCATGSALSTFSLSHLFLFFSLYFFSLSLSLFLVFNSLLSITDTSATRFWTLAPPNSSRTAFTTRTPRSGLRPVAAPRRAHLPPVRSLSRLRVRSQSWSECSITQHSTRFTSRSHSSHPLRVHSVQQYQMNCLFTILIYTTIVLYS